MIAGGTATLNVSDVARATRFYVETLGLKLVADDGPRGARIDAGAGFVLSLVPGEGRDAAPRLHLTPKVPIDDAISILENRGVRFDVTRGGGRVTAVFTDPDGNKLALDAGG